MSIAKDSTAAKFVAAFIGLAMALSVGVAPANAQSVEELTAQIADLLATISSLQAQLSSLQGGGGSTSGGSSSSVCPFAWTQDLTTGSQGPDVEMLQKFLNSDPATQVAASGVGSAGSETDYFGGLTAAAVTAFQNLHAATVLTPVGLSAGTGYFGPSTRAHMNSLCVSAPSGDDTADSSDDTANDTSDDTADSAPAGTGVTVGSGVQPANSIAPDLASRIPFTTFTLTAGSDGPVTIDNVTVERTGFADNNVFAGVVLLGPNMEQIGDAKTLNSNNQAKVGKSYTVPAGQTHQFTVAGNRANTSGKDGQVASLSVVAINTSATVSGSLPITGASHVINESLGIGTAEVSVGPTDPDSNQSEEVGTTNEVFAAVRITNTSSDEDIRVMSIRWQNTGSVSGDDLTNVRTIIDGVEYPAMADGDFYTSQLGSGVVIAEGFNKEAELRGDINDGSGRTVQFNIEEDTDVYIVGETFGFGITAVQTENGTVGAAGSQMTASTPFFDGSLFTVNAGTVTSFSKSNDVASQNIALNVPNQPLGGFEIDIKGEPITVQNMNFYFGFPVKTGSQTGANVTNVSLVDANGAVVAGPVDGAVSGSGGILQFSDSVTFPTGKNTYSLQGKLSTAFANDDTIQASSTPSTDWTNVEGEDTGDTISLSSLSSAVSGNVMTVKAANVEAKISTTPSAQNVVSGVSGMVMSNLQLDGTQSGEDVRFTSLQLRYTQVAGTGDPTNCRLYDGSTQLNDDGVNPSTTGANTFTLDQNVIVPKGTIKTLGVQCDVPGSVPAASAFAWGVNTSDSIQGTGVDSGNTVNALASAATNQGPTMTVSGAGSLTVELDPSSPSYALAAAGTADVTLGVYKVSATNEDIRLDRIALQMSNSAASSSPSDLLTVGIYEGSTHVGTAVFSGTSRNATTTLTQTVIVPKDDDITLTIKGTLSEIGTSDPGTQGALVQVDHDSATTGSPTRGIGQDSGATITHSSGADTAVSGVRLFKSFPVFAKIAVPTTNLVNGQNTFYRFSITADSADDIGLYKLTFQMSTTTGVGVTGANIFAYTDSGFSSPVSGLTRTDGALANTDLTVTGNGDNDVVVSSTAGTLQIPAGVTRYFEIKGTASGVTTNSSVQTTLQGDAAYPGLATLMDTAANIDGDTNDDVIWSPNATTSSGVNHVDWTNGFGIVGLPSTNMAADVLSE